MTSKKDTMASASTIGPSSKRKGKSLLVESAPKCHSKGRKFNLKSPFYNPTSLACYEDPFSTRALVVERSFKPEVLQMVRLFEQLTAYGSSPLFEFNGPTQEEGVNLLLKCLQWESCRSHILLIGQQGAHSPKSRLHLKCDGHSKGIAQSNYFSTSINTLNEKANMTICLCGRLVAWGNHLKKKKCLSLLKFLQQVFTYNLLPTTNRR